jgi:hypothetical protein
MSTKSYTSLYLALAVFILTIGFTSCSNKCKNDQPRARITNNGTDKASVQIQTSGGNTENINNIEVGQVSEWRSYAPGDIEYTVAIQNVSAPIVATVNMTECWEYDIIIDSLNNVSSVPYERE